MEANASLTKARHMHNVRRIQKSNPVHLSQFSPVDFLISRAFPLGGISGEHREA